MSDVLIKNMEMPTGCCALTVKVWPDGQVEIINADGEWKTSEAVPVPPHGDLIGREWLIDIALHLMHTAKNNEIANGVKWLLQYIIEAPTIIQADPAEEGDYS